MTQISRLGVYVCEQTVFACSCGGKTSRLHIGLFCLNGLLCWFITVESNILGYSVPRAIQLNHYNVDFEWSFRNYKYPSSACSMTISFFFLKIDNSLEVPGFSSTSAFANCHSFPVVTSSLASCQDRWPNHAVRYYAAAPSIPGSLSVYHRGMSPCWRVNGISHW